MRYLTIAVVCLFLTGCCNCQKQYAEPEFYADEPDFYVGEQEAYTVPSKTNYQPTKGRVFHVAGLDVQEGQQMRDFFDDFEEPMHTAYSGNNVYWTYYVDYDRAHDEGKIVRYCELGNYRPHSLCKVKVSFAYTYVSNAVTNCY